MGSQLLSILKSKFFTRFIGLNYIPRWVVLILDLFISLVSTVVAFKLADIVGLYNIDTGKFPVPLKVLIVLGMQLFFFRLFHTYSGVLRYSGYSDAVKLFFAVLFSAVSLTLVNLLGVYYFQASVFDLYFLILYVVLAFFLLFLLRIIVRLGFDFLSIYSYNTTPVIVYGTDSDAISIAKAIMTPGSEKLRLVGFIDTDRQVISKRLMGVKVYAYSESFIENVLSKKIKRVIITPSVLANINPKVDLDVFINNGMTVMTIPPMEVWKGEAPSIRQIKTIQIEDLLERAEISISTDKISGKIANKVILVTGAAGSIGSELVKQIIKFNPKAIVLLDQAESPLFDLTCFLKDKYNDTLIRFVDYIGDVRNENRMEQMMSNFRPNIIFHAAAYKHVPLMETHPNESVQANVKGTKTMADLAIKYKVERFVMVSTDKAVNPTNVMGASKRIAEIYVQSLNSKLVQDQKSNDIKTKFITTRFGNVLGSNGSVIPLFKKQIEKGGPITVTHPDIIRYFMTIPEACLLVLEAGTMGEGGEIYIFDMGKPVRIYDMAKKMIRLAGYTPGVDIHIRFTGLRPGEKLYEELLNDKEVVRKTENKKIMVATVREYEYDVVASEIDKLIKLSYTNKDFLIVSQMKNIVPEFKSNNSLYESLDEHVY